MSTPVAPSSALLAAQARLEQLRERLPSERKVRGRSESERPKPAAAANHWTPAEWGQKLLEQRRRQEALAQGERASDTLKESLVSPPNITGAKTQRGEGVGVFVQSIEPSFRGLPEREKRPTELTVKVTYREESGPAEEAVKIYPAIVLGMMEANLEAVGRVWLLLQHLDSQGRGWLEVDEVRQKLTRKQSPLKVCCWRRLRQLFDEGEGVFWTRDDKGRIWLRGAAKVAAALSVERLTGRPVDLPLSVLLGGIQGVRAHFYASFHSGRRENNPISRETLRELTGVPERTQYAYEQTAGVSSQQNIAVGEQYTTENAQERAWQHGRASFRFVDVKGKQGGRPNREYVAWHLPNSYEGPHRQRSKGRQKKINRELADLVNKRAQGNGWGQVERLFWPHGAAAGKAYNRQPRVDVYWYGNKAQKHRYFFWHVLATRVQ